MNDATAISTLLAPPARVSLLEPGRNCCSVTRAHRATVLVDADAYFRAFADAAERAERSILILAWDFDSRTLLRRDEGSRQQCPLGEFLNSLAKRRRGLRIRILDWDFPLIFGTDREVSPLYGLSWTPHRRVRFRYDGTNPLAGSHHQKIAVVDDKVAFTGGLDLTCKRWDTPQHRPHDPRRVDDGKAYPPFHDVMVAVDGPAARVLGDIARARWLKATGERLAPIEVASDPWPRSLRTDFSDVRVGIARTLPPADGVAEVREIERLYLDLIAAARHYIYIENQYFTSSRIGAALAARLAEPAGPEVVVVSRLLSHGWLEEITMQVLRTRLIRELRNADRNGRFHVYCPHIDGLADKTCVDVHSKVTIIDDEWLRIGSANVSNRSMGLDTECDLVIEAESSVAAAQSIRRIRDELLGEHLGVTAEQVGACVEQERTLSAAIERLGSPERTLKPLGDSSEYSDAVISAAAVADPERPVSLETLVDQFAPDTETAPRNRIWLKAASAIAVLLALTAAWRLTPLADVVTPEIVIAQAEALSDRWWAPLLIIAAYTPASVVMFPRPLITLAAVIAFGPWIGFGYAMSGILVAAGVGYLGGRVLSRDTVRRLAGTRLNRLSGTLRRRGLLAMTAVRLAPVAPFTVVSLVAGAIRIRRWDFGLGTFLGVLPGALAATVFGDQLEAGLRDPAQLNYWLLGGAVLLLAFGAFIVHRWLSRLNTHAPHDQTGEA